MILALAFLLTQSPPSFEVASIKPNKSGARAIGNKFEPQRMSWTNVPLKNLIQAAYHLQSYQLLGAPVWASADTWDLDARTESPATMQQKMEMLQTLLADRFQLKFHRETRDLPQYKLVLAKSGPKLQPAKESDQDATRVGRGLIQNPHMTIERLAGFLQGELGRPVLDETALTGSYSVKLEWIPDEGQPNSQGAIPSADSTGPTIFSAVQEQLGLKLEALKGPIEVLIIDRVEKPSAN
jgi:uncharacterized protein (TIGR03435 family)